MGLLSVFKRRQAVTPHKEVDWKEPLTQHFELTQVLGFGGYSTV